MLIYVVRHREIRGFMTERGTVREKESVTEKGIGTGIVTEKDDQNIVVMTVPVTVQLTAPAIVLSIVLGSAR